MTIKNVNVYPAQGKIIDVVIPFIKQPTMNIELPVNYIQKIIASGHKVEENIDGKVILLNISNYAADNSKDVNYSVSMNPNNGSVDTTELEKKYNDLVAEKTSLEKTISDREIEISTLTKSVSDKDAQITTLTKTIGDKDAEIKTLQDQLTAPAK